MLQRSPPKPRAEVRQITQREKGTREKGTGTFFPSTPVSKKGLCPLLFGFTLAALAVHPRAEAGTKGARVPAQRRGRTIVFDGYRGVGPSRTFKAVVSPGNTSTLVTNGSKPSFLNWSS